MTPSGGKSWQSKRGLDLINQEPLRKSNKKISNSAVSKLSYKLQAINMIHKKKWYITKLKHMWGKVNCNQGGYLLMGEHEIPIAAVGVPRKHAMKLLVNDWISESRRKGRGRDGLWKRLRRKPTLWVQPLVLAGYSNHEFSWYGTALYFLIGNYIREWMHIRGSVADIR